MKFTNLIRKISLNILSAVFVLAAAYLAGGKSYLQPTLAAQAGEIVSPAAPAACPASVIDGVIGSGSTDHPFVTGNQTSRLFRDSVESTCGAQKATPSLTDNGIQFKFDAYLFSNTTALPICVTVITTAGANNQLLTAAYDQSFNPANVQTNYLGDAGNSDKTRAFSFTVPGNHSFVVVQSRVNNAANPPSLAYSFRVLGIPTCNSCPPAIISGTIGSGSNQWPADIDTQTGRLFRNATASVCSPAKPVPSVEDAATQFQYDAYTFLNTSLSAVCVTVNTTAAANNQILTAAYLDRFNPFDVQDNYLGDAGNSNQSRSFSFTVPARRSFVVVQSRVNTAGNPPSLGYFFSVSGLTGCTSCPVIAITPDDIPNALMGVPYSQQLTRTGGAGSGTWSVSFGALPNGLSLNSSTGLISGTPIVAGNFSFSARFTDSNGCLGEKVYFFSSIACQTITLGPEPLPRAAVNTLYSQQLTATGGTPAYSFAVIGGTPPAGITLSSSGLLSGTATTTTPANFTVRATDVNGCTGTKTYTLIVCGPITVNPTSVPNGFVGVSYSQTFTQSGAGANPTWSSIGTLPNGLTLNTSTGLLSGTPTTVGAFNFTVRATAFNGCFGERTYTVIISGDGLQFFPLPRPVRLLDTRAGQGNCDNVGTPIAGGTSIAALARTTCESITIPSSAQAIVGNITAVNTTAQFGFLTLYPDGVPQPTSANMIYAPNQVLTNAFTVGLSGAGQFRIFAERQIEAIVDVSGYFAPPTTGGLFFHPLSKPVRLLDTRAGQGNCDSVNSPIGAGTNLVVQGRGACEGLTIPTTAQAIAGNVTVINPNAQAGFMTMYPNGVAQPVAANMVYGPGQLLANAFTVSLSAGGQFNIFAERTIDAILDVSGYYSTEAVDANGTGLLFSPLSAPARLLDTRPGLGNCDNISSPIAAGTSLIVQGRVSCEGQPIPQDAQALVGNLTVINSTSQTGYLTLFPHGVAAPVAANIIYGPGQVLSNAFFVGLSATGEFDVFAERTLHVVLDIGGYFAP